MGNFTGAAPMRSITISLVHLAALWVVKCNRKAWTLLISSSCDSILLEQECEIRSDNEIDTGPVHLRVSTQRLHPLMVTGCTY